jgi:tetratricopeptide (TPR) repeat protein
MNDPKTDSPPPLPRSSFIFHHPSFFPSLLIFTVTLLTFARLIPCGFTWWDDQDTIRQNPRLNPPSWSSVGYYWTNAGEHTTMGLYVPVTYTLWSGLAKIAHLQQPDAEGLTLDPRLFHAANILIHAITTVLVFQLLLRLLAKPLPATFAALLFGLHPVQVEPVAWISGTKDLLCGMFSVAALLMYVRSLQVKSDHPRQRGPARWRYLLGLLFFILAMLSKPTGVMVPLMAIVLALLMFDRPLIKTSISLLPWFLLMIPCVIWTQKVQPPSWVSPLPVWAKPAVAADAITFYFYKLLWPIRLCIDYGHNPPAIAANHLIYFTWIVPAIVALLLLRRYRNHQPAVAAALLFLLPLLPVLGFFAFEFQLISTTSDHYLYLPMLGVALALAWALDRFRVPRWLPIVVLYLLGVRSILQEPVWQDTRTLFLHTLAVNPNSVASMDGLGFVTGRDARQLTARGQANQARPLFDESIDWYRKSLQFDPDSVPSLLNLALDYQAIDQNDLGLQQIHRMVAVQYHLQPGLKADPLTLAHLLIKFRDIPGAITWLDQVLQDNPTNTDAALLREQAIAHLPKPSTKN